MKIPAMTDRPDKRMLICTIAYWLVCFFLEPIFLLYLVYGYYENQSVLALVQIVYSVINGLCAAFIFKHHIGDGFFALRLEPKRFWSTIAICLGLFYGFMGLTWLVSRVLPAFEIFSQYFMVLPAVELEVFMLPADMVHARPLLGTLCVTLATPVTISCLVYALGFAPACEKDPLLGYAVGIGILMLHRTMNYYTTGTIPLEVTLFICQLPLHLCGFIAYHRTNSIWGPMVFLAINNLISCLVLLVL